VAAKKLEPAGESGKQMSDLFRQEAKAWDDYHTLADTEHTKFFKGEYKSEGARQAAWEDLQDMLHAEYITTYEKVWARLSSAISCWWSR